MIGTFWNLCRACPSVPVDKLHSEYRSTYRWHELAGQRQEIIRKAPQTHSSIGSGACEPAIPRRRKHPEIAYRTHDFLVSIDGGTEHLLEKAVVYDRARSEERWSHNRQKSSRRSKSEGPPTAQTSYRLLNSQHQVREEHETNDDKVPDNQKMSQSLDEATSRGPGGSSEYKLQFAWPPVSAVLSTGLANICAPRKSISMSGIKSKGHIDDAVPVHRRNLAAKAHKDITAMNNSVSDADAVPATASTPRTVKAFSSEYTKQFQPFYNYNFDENRGTWDEKKLSSAKENAPVFNENMVVDTHNSNWYKEVVLLRKKANQYRHRGWGTELVPDHIAQLYSDQMSVWDQVSRRSTLSALSLATTLITKSNRQPSKEDKERDVRRGSPIKSTRSRSAKSETDGHTDKPRARTPASARSEPAPTKGNARIKPKSLDRVSPKTRNASKSRSTMDDGDVSDLILPTVRRPRPSKEFLKLQQSSSNTSMATTASVIGSDLSRLSYPSSRTQSAPISRPLMPPPPPPKVRTTVNYNTPKPTKPRSRSSPPRCSRLARDHPDSHCKPSLPSRFVQKKIVKDTNEKLKEGIKNDSGTVLKQVVASAKDGSINTQKGGAIKMQVKRTGTVSTSKENVKEITEKSQVREGGLRSEEVKNGMAEGHASGSVAKNMVKVGRIKNKVREGMVKSVVEGETVRSKIKESKTQLKEGTVNQFKIEDKGIIPKSQGQEGHVKAGVVKSQINSGMVRNEIKKNTVTNPIKEGPVKIEGKGGIVKSQDQESQFKNQVKEGAYQKNDKGGIVKSQGQEGQVLNKLKEFRTKNELKEGMGQEGTLKNEKGNTVKNQDIRGTSKSQDEEAQVETPITINAIKNVNKEDMIKSQVKEGTAKIEVPVVRQMQQGSMSNQGSEVFPSKQVRSMPSYIQESSIVTQGGKSKPEAALGKATDNKLVVDLATIDKRTIEGALIQDREATSFCKDTIAKTKCEESISQAKEGIPATLQGSSSKQVKSTISKILEAKNIFKDASPKKTAESLEKSSSVKDPMSEMGRKDTGSVGEKKPDVRITKI